MPNLLLDGLDAYWRCDDVPRITPTQSLGTKDYSRHDKHVIALSGIAFSTGVGGVDGGVFVNQGSDIANRRGLPNGSRSRHFKYGNQSFSVNYWVRRVSGAWSPNSSDPFHAVWNDNATDQRSWAIVWQGNIDVHQFLICPDGTLGNIVTVDTPSALPSADVWHMVSAGYDAELGHIWVQIDAGTRNITAYTAGAFAASTADYTQMFATFGGVLQMSDGSMDEASIHGRVLDAADITAMYAGGSSLTLDSWDASPAPTGVFPFTDVDVQFDSHLEEDGSLELRDQVAVPSALNFTAIGTPPVPSILGFMGYGRRGLGNTPRLERTTAIGDHFDISGLTSWSMIVWARMDTALDNFPQVFGIFDTSPAGEQFFSLTLEASGVNPIVPVFNMYDGLSLDNKIALVADPRVPFRLERWQMLGLAFDAVTQEMRLFWGREPHEAYYVTTTGFAAGFGAASSSTPVAFGKFGGASNRLGIDHFSWTKGRAYSEGDFYEHWRNYHGLAFSNFDATPEPPSGGDFFDFTDKDATWLCEEASNTDDLVAVEGAAFDLARVGTNALSVTGKFGQARGFTKAIGEGNATYFRQDQISGNAIFDIRGATSLTVVGWLKLRSTTDGSPTFFDIHSVAVAGQALISWFHQDPWANLSPNGVPVMGMEDGLIAFKGLNISANHDPTPGVLQNEYQFMGITYDAELNKMRCFWGERGGVAGGQYHFSEGRGFVGGFKYARQSGSGAPNFPGVGFARFTGSGLPAQLDIDHLFYYKGRAFTLRDFLNMWNGGVGLDNDELVSAGPDIAVNDVAFGDVQVGQQGNGSITIQNLGNLDLTVAAISTPGGEFGITIPSLPFVIIAAGSEVVPVTFDPTLAGAAAATVDVTSDDPDTPIATSNLTGNGTPLPIPTSVAAPVSIQDARPIRIKG